MRLSNAYSRRKALFNSYHRFISITSWRGKIFGKTRFRHNYGESLLYVALSKKRNFIPRKLTNPAYLWRNFNFRLTWPLQNIFFWVTMDYWILKIPPHSLWLKFKTHEIVFWAIFNSSFAEGRKELYAWNQKISYFNTNLLSELR